MRIHSRKSCTLLATVAAVALLVPAAALGQAPEDWTLPRTPDGQPDLQGVWANNNITPLERPEAWAGKESLSDEELAALRVAAAQAVDDGDALFGDQLVLAAIANQQASSYDPTTGNYNQFWIVERDFSNRTSLVTDPPDGRVPALTPEAEERRAERFAYARAHPADSYVDRPLSERCVTYGVPRLGAGYNSYYQIFQSADHVVIYMEMNHDARVIPLDGTPHLDESVRQWHGDSRGRWEGDTLVVETTNLKRATNFSGASSELRLVERFRRVGPEILQYEFTMHDPTTWTRPWTARLFMRPAPGTGVIYEFACHEGNYAIANTLRGARLQEAAEAETNQP